MTEITPLDRDMMIRTVIGEAAGQPTDGQAAVAHVIMTRAKSGKYGGSSPYEVVVAPGQFEPWSTRAKELIRINPNSKSYQSVGKIVDQVVSGEIPDPTNGATHFLEESIVKKRRGGTLPEWARGKGLRIGDHTFHYPDAPGTPITQRTIPLALNADNQPTSYGSLGSVTAAAAASGKPVMPPPGEATPPTKVATMADDYLDLFDPAKQTAKPAPEPTQAAAADYFDMFPTRGASETPAVPVVASTPSAGPVKKASVPIADSPGMITGLVRSAAEGIPLLGALPPRLNALTNAALSPVMPNDKTISQATTFGQRYSENLARERGMSEAFEQEHPYLSTAASVAGGVGATLPVAATKVGGTLLGLAGRNIAQRSAASAASGAAIGGTDAALRGKDPDTGALIGGVVGGAAPAVGRVIGAGVDKIKNAVTGQKPATVPSTDAIYDAAEAGYNAIRGMDVRIKPQAIQSLATNVQKDLATDGIRDYLAPRTFKLLEELQKGAAPGSHASFADLHGIRRVLGKVARSPDATESMAATRTMKELDGYLSNMPASDVIKGDAKLAVKTFKDAQGNYAAAKRADVIAGKIEQATEQAASAHSGLNVENSLRQRIRDILKSDKLSRGFNDEELDTMRKIVKGTAPANITRHIGNLLGGGGGLGSVVTGVASGVAAFPYTTHHGALATALATPIVGTGIRKLSNVMANRKAGALDELVRSRAPEAQNAVGHNMLMNILRGQRINTGQNVLTATGRGVTPRLTADGYPFFDNRDGQ